jgi:microsomal dipeptidase-like Zn-dependent dipeptidase
MKIAVVLDDIEWGQVLDGLRCRAEIYEVTVRYYESGYAESEIAEVRDENEARKLADLYRNIIGKIDRALVPRR